MADELDVKGNKIRMKDFGDKKMFSLTDMAKNFGQGDSHKVLYRWFKNNDTLDYLDAYEDAFNPNYKGGIKEEFGKKGDGRSVKEYIKFTETPFMKSQSGRYGGTWAVFDIAADFMMWISAPFKVWFVKEFRLMKQTDDINKLAYDEWKSQKKVDSLMEVLRFEQDELKLIQEKKEKEK